MQNIIEKGPESYKKKILEMVKKNFVSLSLNKFASHVSEKAIKNSDSLYRR